LFNSHAEQYVKLSARKLAAIPERPKVTGFFRNVHLEGKHHAVLGG
jgi:hypothetical protein